MKSHGGGEGGCQGQGLGSLNSPSRGGHARRTVIFSADDFGSSEAVNGAVALAHRQGLLGSASLMAAGPQVAAAVRLAKELPGLCLGVHLTLIKGRAISSPQKIPHLVDSQGHFGNCPVAVGWRYFLQPRLLPEIRRELASQIEAVLRLGLQPWHLNSHLNLHMHPRIFPLVVDLAREYDIPAVRLVREDWRTTLALAPDHPFPKLAQGLIFALLCRRARRIARAAGLFSNDRVFWSVKRWPHDRNLSPGPDPPASGGGHRDLQPSGAYRRPGNARLPPPARVGRPAQSAT